VPPQKVLKKQQGVASEKFVLELKVSLRILPWSETEAGTV